MGTTFTGGSYDNDYLGSSNSQHPANQIEVIQTDRERMENYILDQARELKQVKEWLKEMEEMEASGACRITGLSTEDERKYLSLRERARYKIKSLGHGID